MSGAHPRATGLRPIGSQYRWVFVYREWKQHQRTERCRNMIAPYARFDKVTCRDGTVVAMSQVHFMKWMHDIDGLSVLLDKLPQVRKHQKQHSRRRRKAVKLTMAVQTHAQVHAVLSKSHPVSCEPRKLLCFDE